MQRVFVLIHISLLFHLLVVDVLTALKACIGFIGVYIHTNTTLTLGRSASVLILPLLLHQLPPHQQVEQKTTERRNEGNHEYYDEEYIENDFHGPRKFGYAIDVEYFYEYNEKYSFEFHQPGKKGCRDVQAVPRLPPLIGHHLTHYAGVVLVLQRLYFTRHVVGCIGRREGAGSLKNNFAFVVHFIDVVDRNPGFRFASRHYGFVYKVAVHTLPAVFGK